MSIYFQNTTAFEWDVDAFEWQGLESVSDYTFAIDPGAYTITGSQIDFPYDRVLNVESGSYSISGQPVIFGITTAQRFGTVVYLFTLTGDDDGLDDIEIPITSFQARLRSGDPTYLKTVMPYSAENAAAISARVNGTMQIDLAYKIAGEYTDRETIIQANLEDIRLDIGPMNKSISLTGHKQTTYSAKSIELLNPTYRNMINGALRYRFAEPSLHLYPGDTVTVGDDTFVANVITYYVNARTGSVETNMEIAEA